MRIPLRPRHTPRQARLGRSALRRAPVSGRTHLVRVPDAIRCIARQDLDITLILIVQVGKEAGDGA